MDMIKIMDMARMIYGTADMIIENDIMYIQATDVSSQFVYRAPVINTNNTNITLVLNKELIDMFKNFGDGSITINDDIIHFDKAGKTADYKQWQQHESIRANIEIHDIDASIEISPKLLHDIIADVALGKVINVSADSAVTFHGESAATGMWAKVILNEASAKVNITKGVSCDIEVFPILHFLKAINAYAVTLNINRYGVTIWAQDGKQSAVMHVSAVSK